MKNLEAKIEERKREAIQKKIESKAQAIAEFLGSGYSCHDPREEISRHFRFHQDKFLITDQFCSLPERGTESGIDVIHLGHLVYQSRKYYVDPEVRITSYIPGEWEAEFNLLYEKSQRVQNGGETRPEALTEEVQLRARWGL